MFGHRFHTLRADAMRSLRGVAAMLRWGVDVDELPVALGSFLACSPRARAGATNAYEVELANPGADAVAARVLIDIYRRDDPTHPHGHYGYFEKTLYLPARSALRATITYDWQHAAQFVIDGVGLAADVLWRGPCKHAGTYDVRAVLVHPPPAEIRPLGIVQELN